MARASEITQTARGKSEHICAYYELQVASWIAQLQQIRALPEAPAHHSGDRAVSVEGR